MRICLIILVMMVCILLLFLILQKMALRSIAKQLRKIGSEDTNALVKSDNGSFGDMINEINKLLKETRDNRILYQQKKHNLEQMMTNISHDLRTPLTSAMGYIHIIQHSDLDEEEQKRELAIVEKKLGRLEELINSFFEFSQIISVGRQPDKEAVNFVAVLEASVVHYYDDYSSQNREIILKCRQNRLLMNSNKNMLMRILDNAIHNALKHGTGNLIIEVHVDENVNISFENAQDYQDIDTEHIFDEFYTTDISRTKGSTGLGLAIAKQFTELLGGTISAENKEDTFLLSMSFPMK